MSFLRKVIASISFGEMVEYGIVAGLVAIVAIGFVVALSDVATPL